MKKRILALCLMMIVLTGAVVFSGHAAWLFDFPGKKQKTVTISQEEYERLLRPSACPHRILPG